MLIKISILLPAIIILINVIISLLMPYSVQTFAFITTFLALLVLSILAVQKVSTLKKQSVQLEVQP